MHIRNWSTYVKSHVKFEATCVLLLLQEIFKESLVKHLLMLKVNINLFSVNFQEHFKYCCPLFTVSYFFL